MMKHLILKLILPLTIISFVIFTKWWYVDVIDGPDEILIGFPVPYMCQGWHTSLSLQIFISGFLIDFLTYFAFWFSIILLINKFIRRIRPHKIITITLLTLSGLFLSGIILIGSNPDNIYTFNRKFEVEIFESGYKMIWQNQTRPDYFKYHPKKKSTIELMQGQWFHDQDSLASVTINNFQWTFNYVGEIVNEEDYYSISIIDKLPEFVNETEKSEFLILTRNSDTLKYEILGLTDSTFSMMYFPAGKIHLYIRKK